MAGGTIAEVNLFDNGYHILDASVAQEIVTIASNL